MEEALLEPLDVGLISEVLYVVKSGKEATVYCCRSGPALKIDTELVAVKVYRERDNRSFKNDAVYWEGHLMTDPERRRSNGSGSRAGRAFTNKSRAGQAMQAGGWTGRELETLELLYHAGADVPQPHQLCGRALVMEYIGGAEGPGTPLIKAEIPKEAVPKLYKRLIEQIGLWLSQNRIHGDLSPYNILYHEERLTVIDFPQAVDPRANRNACELLFRDVGNVCNYFTRYGVRDESGRIAADYWARFLRSEW